MLPRAELDLGRFATIEDAQGKITNLTYDEDGHIIRVDDPFGRHASFAYDLDGNMVEAVDMEGQAFQYTYDSDARVKEINTAQGAWQFYHEGPDGDPSGSDRYPAPGTGMWQNMRLTVTNPLGYKEEFFYYGGLGMLAEVEERLDGNQSWYVDQNHYREYQDWLVNNGSNNVPKTIWVTDKVIDGKGKITRTFYPDSSSEAYDYSSSLALPLVTRDGLGKEWTVTRNNYGLVTSSTGPNGLLYQYNYAPNGLDVTSIVDAENNTTTALEYNSKHQPTRITNALNQSTDITYTAWGAVASVTVYENQVPHVTTYTYDSQTKKLSNVKYDGITQATYTYNAAGLLQSVTDMLSRTVAYEYNDLDKLTKVTYPDGTSTRTEYVCCNMPGMTIDRAGRKTY